MQRRYKILFVSEETDLTGAGMVLLRIVRKLDKTRFAPILLTHRLNQRLIRPLEEDGIPCFPSDALGSIESLHAFETGLGLRKTTSRFGLVRRLTLLLTRCIKEQQVDLIHANNYPLALYCSFAALLTRTPLLFHEHNLRPIQYHNWLNYKFLGLACTAAAVVSEACRSNLTPAIPRRKITVIRNGVDLSLPSTASESLRRTFNIGPTDPLIALVGQPREEKGSHIYIEAAAEIVAHYPNARFLIVGYLFDGDPYQRRLYALVESLGLTDRVIFTGWRNDIPALMASADLLVHCRLTPEPAALVLTEAMAAARPIVVSDTGGSREIVVHDVTGRLYPPGDARALARAVLEILQDPDRARLMGLAGRKRAEEMFSLERQVAEFESLYLSLLRRDRV